MMLKRLASYWWLFPWLMLVAGAVGVVGLLFVAQASNITVPFIASQAFAFGSLPVAGAANADRVFFLSDGFHLLRSTGAAFFYFGPLHAMTQPLAASFTGVNMGAATLTDVGALILTAPTGGGGHRMQCQSVPAAPFTLTVAFDYKVSAATNSSVGFLFRESSTGKLAGWIVQRIVGNIELLSAKWDSATVFNSTYTAESAPGVLMQLGMAQHPVFLRLADDNTNRIISLSKNGRDFLQFHSIGRLDFLTVGADQACFTAGTAATGETTVNTLYSWLEQ